jgi:hypothetical protein
VKIFFATDIHGSQTCWRKFLNSAPHYGADVVILGGDITGKALVPIIHDGGEAWHGTLQEQRHNLSGEAEVADFEANVMRRGYYPFRVEPDELAELERDEQRLDALFHEKMMETVERWLAMADERLTPKGIRCYVSPGNDDQLDIDGVIESANGVVLGEGRVVDIDDFQMVSTGWSNVTPWKTYREDSEPDLYARIERVADTVQAAPEKTIFNLHCPPFGSGLDEAPGVNEDMTPKHGGHAPEPVGSTAVRRVIEEHRPVLSLHGHIHEARGHTRIGPTLCINPGSAYEQGQLLGALVELDGKKVKNFVLTSG